MGWNKNTFNYSKLDEMVEFWERSGDDYVVEELGRVRGRGLNDRYSGNSYYSIRRAINLTHKVAIYEQMVRVEEPDAPDFIRSKTFFFNNLNELPSQKEWKVIVYEKNRNL